ncbi:MAG: hypothetical protein WA364_07435 [Candidatus Nitrosopolaris sp.]
MPLNKSWHEYNVSLIERGRILMDIGFLGSSKREIKNMNKGKVGARQDRTVLFHTSYTIQSSVLLLIMKNHEANDT